MGQSSVRTTEVPKARNGDGGPVNAPRVRSSDLTLQLTGCPDCGLPAEITRRAVLPSTDGPVEHVGVCCVGRHVFLLPTFLLRQG